VGSHLSGGLDSSAATLLAARSEHKPAAFSWSPPPPAGAAADGEYERIGAVCHEERLTCHYLPATVESLTETFRTDFTVDPVAMMAREANVQRKAAELGIRVMLSGWGGDEAASIRSSNSLSDIFSGNPAAFRDAVAKRIGAGGPLRGARRLAGIVRDMVVPRLPDAVYGLTANPYLKHRAPCIQDDFAHLYRREAEELAGPAFRNLPDLRSTIRSRLETGHLSLRMEHWAASGARHGIEYRYPMLDRRLVEFALGIPASELYDPGTREALLQRAMRELLPSSAEWQNVKTERHTLDALKEQYFRAHFEWAEKLLAGAPDPAVTRFVDPGKIRAAVRAGSGSEPISSLSGVREAFGCYAIRRGMKVIV
jgi:asparagine synthase (glutamine-hydrolysing)